MIALLESIARYLASKTNMVAGTNIFCNEMPDSPTKCVLIQEIQNPNVMVLPQIDAEVHRIEITTRDESNDKALALAQLCWRWLLTDNLAFSSDTRADTTGFITLADQIIVQVTLYGNPVWKKSDQQNRKYYHFFATVITKR